MRKTLSILITASVLTATAAPAFAGMKINPNFQGGNGMLKLNPNGGGNFGGGGYFKKGYGHPGMYGAAGLALGMMAGAAMAGSYSHGPVYSGGDCFPVRKRFIDADGFVYTRRVVICQ